LLDNFPTHLDAFPPPAFDLLHKNDYLVVMTSRGCPLRCTFCATYKIDSAFSQRQPHHVVEEILTQTRRFDVQDVAFYDDALLMQADRRIKPILHEIAVSNRSLRFHTPNGLHARYIDEELADLMYRCNFKTVRLSLESIAKERLRDIHNKITPGEMTRAVQHLVKAGYQPHELETYIIMGLPHQSAEEVIETILYAHNLGIRIRLSSFSPIPGTVDYERAIAQGHFPAEADPLLTNNTTLPLSRTTEAYERAFILGRLVYELNLQVQNGMAPSKPSGVRQQLQTALSKPWVKTLESIPKPSPAQNPGFPLSRE
jgi:radical SAM superfamily enzyme YgiQ (UPF0313 family)